MDLTEEIQKEMVVYTIYSTLYSHLSDDNPYVLKVIICFYVTILLNYTRILTQNFKFKINIIINRFQAPTIGYSINFPGIY